MQRVRIAPRPLKEVAPDVPPFFTRIVMRCLEKNPSARYQTARDLLMVSVISAFPGTSSWRRA